ncbi:hypothetical protein, partial [uncultured Duncaniella sp.]|uniref:hypothetical protein n=1 Tax=uncultured Duncaniella sp. TaxID=2768039 RepID=UPI0025A99DD5
MEYHNGVYCVSARELIEGGIMTQGSYAKAAQRKRIEVVRPGKGSGNYALIAVDSLSTEQRIQVEAQFGGKAAHIAAWVRSNYTEDQEAMAFFNNPQKTGISNLSIAKRREYVVNASVLNTCIKLYDNAAAKQRLMGNKYDWTCMTGVIESLRVQFGHTLPTSVLRFRKKVSDYRKRGYESLLSGKFGNSNAQILTAGEERVLKGLAVQPNRPWNTNVREMYEMFVCGELDVWDPETGELLDPEKCARKKNGEPWVPSEATIAGFLNRPDIKAFVDRWLKPNVDYYHEVMPHVHRHRGQYSLSQITMDDVDLPFRMKGNERVHAYYAYDSVSECVIAASYGRKKDEALVDECFRELFRLIKRRQWGMPAGVEVENHLMTRHKDGLLAEGVVFSRVRFCAPQNSQDKQAEPLNGAKKRKIIHKNHEEVGRFYGKGKWRTYQKKVSDDTNALWEDKRYYTFEEMVANDRADNREWNNTLHPDQKTYPGMTRWEVLISNINPNLRPYDELTLARYLGMKVETSIRRHSTVKVRYADWWLSTPEVLGRLKPNNYKVTAYYLPDENGEAQDVYIYQGDRYLDKVEKVETFNRVMVEQTEEDKAKFTRQMQKIEQFKAYLNKNA